MKAMYQILYADKDAFVSVRRLAIENNIYHIKGIKFSLRYQKQQWFYKDQEDWIRVIKPYHLIAADCYIAIDKIDQMPLFAPCYYEQDDLLIGRSHACFLRYDHQEVSRKHMRIMKQDDDWYLLDLHSRNGVYVNGKRAYNVRLKVGDCIQFSQYTIYFFPYCLIYEQDVAIKQACSLTQIDEKQSFDLRIQPMKLPTFDVACIHLQPPKQTVELPMHSFMQLLPSVLMGVSSVMMSAMMVFSMSKQQFDIKHLLPGLAMMVMMILTQTILPIIIHRAEKKQAKKKQAQAKVAYASYLRGKDEQLLAQATAYQAYNHMYASLWLPDSRQQQIPIWFLPSSHEQFLSFTIGTRKIPYHARCDFTPLEFEQPQKECEVWYQKLVDTRNKVIEQAIFYNFKRYKSIGIYGSHACCVAFSIVWQLCKNQSPKDCAVMLILPEEITRHYHLRFLPHLWLSNQVRLLYEACTSIQFQHVLDLIQEENKACLIVSMETIPYLPKENCYWLQISNNQDVLSSSHTIVFGCMEQGLIQVQEYQDCYQLLYQGYKQSYVIKAFQQLSSFLHSKKQYPPFYFLDLYQVCDVKDLHLQHRWRAHHGKTLRVPIGIDEEKKILYLDAHASKHGPHGILAGMTGAGKSEWLMTYILSLCISFSCEKVSFVIVDYKGGMMGNAFLSIPHICNVITNLEKQRIQRFLDALESEIVLREAMFEEAKAKVGASFCDIDVYQAWYDKGIVKQAMAHLFLIVDEFAEMKSESPQALQVITKIARIGRSLGIHVLLATQKPYGIISDQIWSNSHFHVCLKVQERSDSMDVIKKEDAWYLKEAGEFYLQVGHDEYFAKGKSSYTQAPYCPSQEYEQATLKKVDIYQDQGAKVYSKQVMKKECKTQFEAVCFELARVQKECEYQTPFFLPQELQPRCDDTLCTNMHLCLGEYEDSKKRKQGTWTLPLQHIHNLLILGSNIEELEDFVKKVCFECERCYTSKQCVVLLFHSNFMLDELENLSVVSLICSHKEKEKLDEVLERLEQWKQEQVEIVIFLHDPATFKIHHPIFLQRFEQELSMQQEHLHMMVLSKHINTLSMSMFSYMEQFVIFHMQDEKEYQSYFHDLKIYPRFIKDNGVYMDEDKTFEIQLHPYEKAIQQQLLQTKREKNAKITCLSFPNVIQARYQRDALYVGLAYDDLQEVWLSLQESKQIFVVSNSKHDYETYLGIWKEKMKSDWQIQTSDFKEAIHCIYVLSLDDVYAMQFYSWFRSALCTQPRLWIGSHYEQGVQVLQGNAKLVAHKKDAILHRKQGIQKVKRLEV